MKSFMQSLPSHRKKEKVRKSRHHAKSRSVRQTSTASLALDGRASARAASASAADGRGGAGEYQSQSPGESIVEATEIQYPPPPPPHARGLPRVSLGYGMHEEGGGEGNNDDDDAVETAENEDHAAGSSEETTLSQSAESVVEATQVQFPPPRRMAAAAVSTALKTSREEDAGGRGVNEKIRSSSSGPLPLSPVQSAPDMAGLGRPQYDKAFDEETVMETMDSPPADKSGGARNNGHSIEDRAGDPGEAKRPADCGRNAENDAISGKPKGSNREGGIQSARRNLSLELEPRGSMNREGRRPRPTEENLSMETHRAANTCEKLGETANPALARTSNPSSATNEVEPGPQREGKLDGEQPSREAHDEDDDTEFMLATSDVEDCINAIEIARKSIQSNGDQDPFHGIDIEQWQSTLKEFQKYLTALGDPTSTEAEELQQINNHDKVFAIFDRGMDVNHCNVVFIYNMIGTISSGINALGKSLSHQAQGTCKKLDHLAACLDMIFGVKQDSDDPTTAVAVSVLKANRDSATVLKFSMSLATSQLNETTLLTGQQTQADTLPPHLHAMSKVFEQFTTEKTRPIQSQLESTLETLAATREGAMDLQRQALQLQEDLQVSQTEAEEAKAGQERAEADLTKQKYEFERKEESFERVKEHYKAQIDRKESELANMKDKYELELKDAKAALEKAMRRHTEQRSVEQRSSEQRKRKSSNDTGDRHQMKHHRSGHHRHHGMSHPESNTNLLADTDDKISPSIPRHIEYQATDPFDSDIESSGKKSKLSDRKSRHSADNVSSRKRHSAPYELQPPRRSRSEPKSRHKTDEHESKNDHTGESDRRYSRMGATQQRNPLKSLTGNSHTGHGATFQDKEESSRKLERSSRKVQQTPQERTGQVSSRKSSNFASSSNQQKAMKNPYLKTAPKPSKKVTKGTASDGEPSFAYQEVVRGREKRQALPGHECEECRKFHEALGEGFDRHQLVMECSRHRARHAPPSTPPDFWKMTFVDSVGSNRSTDSL